MNKDKTSLNIILMIIFIICVSGFVINLKSDLNGNLGLMVVLIFMDFGILSFIGLMVINPGLRKFAITLSAAFSVIGELKYKEKEIYEAIYKVYVDICIRYGNINCTTSISDRYLYFL